MVCLYLHYRHCGRNIVKPYSSMMSCVYQQWGDLVVHCGRNSGLERDSARVHVSNQWVDMSLAIIPQNHSSPIL